ncbi:glutathione S-transferase-like protein [Irpex rosettiformis]|uniref:Glutathione S-transferase-like protein n=1 Tax=Irpex rosettiformis TaxID=378272 RepID=A0ACB8UD58_9APHY|nr:glutathione S-transferase-like protein [Irpex rosettiformis]
MVFKLFGNARSRPTLRVAHILKEMQVPFEFVAIDVQGNEHKTAEYLKKQPFGQIPYIDDDGFVLFETRAICKYIATKWRGQGPALFPDPSDLKATALFDQALSIEYSNFDNAAVNIAVEKVYKPKYLNKPTDEALVAEQVSKLEAKLEGYEAILSKQKYLAGEYVTLADLYHITFGFYIVEEGGLMLFTDEAKYPNMARWWKDITSRPAWLAVKGGL